MVEEAQIYRDVMRFKPDDLTPNAWAVKAGVSRAVWADMRRHGNPSRRTLQKLLGAIGSSLAEFEALRPGDERFARSSAASGLGESGTSAWSPAQLPTLPMVGTSLAGELDRPGGGIALIEIRSDEIIDRLPRPVALVSDPLAFAITMVATSMWPRFRPGRRIAVSPRSPVAIGDDVLVSLSGSGEKDGSGKQAVIGELVRRAKDSVELRQFQPARDFSLGDAEIESMYRIAGELI